MYTSLLQHMLKYHSKSIHKGKNMCKNKLNQAYTLAFIPSEQKADQTVIPSLIPSKTNQAAVDSLQLDRIFTHSKFYISEEKAHASTIQHRVIPHRQ